MKLLNHCQLFQYFTKPTCKLKTLFQKRKQAFWIHVLQDRKIVPHIGDNVVPVTALSRKNNIFLIKYVNRMSGCVSVHRKMKMWVLLHKQETWGSSMKANAPTYFIGGNSVDLIQTAWRKLHHFCSQRGIHLPKSTPGLGWTIRYIFVQRVVWLVGSLLLCFVWKGAQTAMLMSQFNQSASTVWCVNPQGAWICFEERLSKALRNYVKFLQDFAK